MSDNNNSDIEVMLSDLRNRLLEWRGCRHQGTINTDRSATACMTAAWMSGAQNFGILDNDGVISIAERIRELGNSSLTVSNNNGDNDDDDDDDDNHVRQDARLLLDARICLENALMSLKFQDNIEDDHYIEYNKESDDNDHVMSDTIMSSTTQGHTMTINDDILNEKTGVITLYKIFGANMTLQECVDILNSKRLPTEVIEVGDNKIDDGDVDNNDVDDDVSDFDNNKNDCSSKVIDAIETINEPETIYGNDDTIVIEEGSIVEQRAPFPEPYPLYLHRGADQRRVSPTKELQINYDGDICIPLKYSEVEFTEDVLKKHPQRSLYDRHGHFIGSSPAPLRDNESMKINKCPSTCKRTPRPIGELLEYSTNINTYSSTNEILAAVHGYDDYSQNANRKVHVIRRGHESHHKYPLNESRSPAELALKKSRLKTVQLQADMARVGYSYKNNKTSTLNRSNEVTRSKSAPPRRTTSIFQRTKHITKPDNENICNKSAKDDSSFEVAEVARRRAALRIKQKKMEMENRRRVEEQAKEINDRLKSSERDRKIANFVDRQTKRLSSPNSIPKPAEPWNIDSPWLFKSENRRSTSAFSSDALAAVGLSPNIDDNYADNDDNFDLSTNDNNIIGVIQQAIDLQQDVHSLVNMNTPDFKHLQLITEETNGRNISPISIAGLHSNPNSPDLKSEVISICIKQAFDLSDALGGTNPYVVLDWEHLGRVSTKTVLGSTNPKFDTIFRFESPYRLATKDNEDVKNGRIVYASKQKYISVAPHLHLYVYSKNQSVSDELIGEADVNVDNLFSNGHGFVELYDLNNEFAGSAELSIRF